MAAEPRTLTIVGGGLAGLSLAIALRQRGTDVILHEATTYPRHRVCGEFISGLGTHTLRTLGIEEALTDAVAHRSTIWYRGDYKILETDLPEVALSLSRHKLDARLFKQLETLGGTVHQGSRFKPTDHSVEGLVWASGRQASKGSPWIGLKAHLMGFESAHGLEMHLTKDCYVGVAGIEGGRTNVCALFKAPLSGRPGSMESFATLFAERGLSRFAERLSTSRLDPSSVIGVSALPFHASSRIQRPRTSAGQCALGDAYAQIPPFTGNGMTMAFQSAEVALPHLEAYAMAATDWGTACERIQGGLHERFHKRLTRAGWLHPLLTQTWGQPLLGLSRCFRHRPFRLLYHATR